MRAPGGARFAYNPDIPRPPEAHLPMNSPLSDTDQLADARGWWFVQRGREVLLDEMGGVPCGPNPLLGLDPLPVLQVGEFDGMPCFAVELPLDAPFGGFFGDPKRLYDSLPLPARTPLSRALEVLEWDRTHRFCGSCGAPTEHRGAAIVRHCSNDACGREHFPRVSPVVIMAVERGEEILLGRSHHFPPGVYSVLAGFVDAGESAEQAVHREIFEETALAIRDVRYFASQPWPFPHSLMLGFQAEWAGGEIACDPREIEDAAFFHVDRLPKTFRFSSTLSFWLIQDFCKRHGRPWPDGA